MHRLTCQCTKIFFCRHWLPIACRLKLHVADWIIVKKGQGWAVIYLEDLRILSHGHSHFSLWHAMRAGKVDFKGINARLLTPLYKLLPSAFVKFLHDGCNQHPACNDQRLVSSCGWHASIPFAALHVCRGHIRWANSDFDFDLLLGYKCGWTLLLIALQQHCGEDVTFGELAWHFIYGVHDQQNIQPNWVRTIPAAPKSLGKKSAAHHLLSGNAQTGD